MGGCIQCFGSGEDERTDPVMEGGLASQSPHMSFVDNSAEVNNETSAPRVESIDPNAVHIFKYEELSSATNDFHRDHLLAEGGYGPVYKGRLKSGLEIAVKKLDRGGPQGSREFNAEIRILSPLNHPNIVNLVGCCNEGDHRIIVYKFMPLGSLDLHLHGLTVEKEPLDWNTRMKIAVGTARGLEYLHKQTPLIIYRDCKSSNILLDNDYNPKISDFGLAREGPEGDMTHVSTVVLGTMGYVCPEYYETGNLSVKSDVYSFGVVLIELITGRQSIEDKCFRGEGELVPWARKRFKLGKYARMADPLLQGHYPVEGLYRALAIASCCWQETVKRPDMETVAKAISVVAAQGYNPPIQESPVDAGGASSSSTQGYIEQQVDAGGASSSSTQGNRNMDLNRERQVDAGGASSSSSSSSSSTQGNRNIDLNRERQVDAGGASSSSTQANIDLNREKGAEAKEWSRTLERARKG